MQETLVGILGVVLVIGSMVVVIETQTADGPRDSLTDDSIGPPPILGEDTWRTDGCLYASLGWQVSASSVEEHTGPWTPRESGGSVFVGLFAYECDSSTVSGVAQQGQPAGGGVMIFVEAPGENLTRNATDGDEFAAMPEAFVAQAEGELARAYSEHAFEVTQADVNIATTDLLVGGSQTTITWSTDQGTIEARGVFTDAGSDGSTSLDLLATSEATFGLVTGDLEASGVATSDTVTVTSDGDTWVSELGLGSSPDEAGLLDGATWDLRLLHRSMGGNTTSPTE